MSTGRRTRRKRNVPLAGYLDSYRLCFRVDPEPDRSDAVHHRVGDHLRHHKNGVLSLLTVKRGRVVAHKPPSGTDRIGRVRQICAERAHLIWPSSGNWRSSRTSPISRRTCDEPFDQAGEIDLVPVGAAHQEIREGNVDGGRLVDLQDALGVVGDGLQLQQARYSEMIEELTRAQGACLPQPGPPVDDLLRFVIPHFGRIEPDLTIEMFLMDGPVPGFGALELVEPPAPEHGSDNS